MLPKKSKRIELSEYSQQSQSENEKGKLAIDDIECNPEIKNNFLKLKDTPIKHHGNKKIITYPKCQFFISNAEIDQIQKHHRSLRPIYLIQKILDNQFQSNSKFVEQNPSISLYLKQCHKDIKNILESIIEQRKIKHQNDECNYVRHEEDLYNLRKNDVINCLIKKTAKNKVKKNAKRRKIKFQILLGRSKSMKKNAPQDYILRRLIKIIYQICFKIHNPDLNDQIRHIQEQSLKWIAFKLVQREKDCKQIGIILKDLYDKVFHLQKTINSIRENLLKWHKLQNQKKRNGQQFFLEDLVRGF